MISVEKLSCNVMPFYLTIPVKMTELEKEDKKREFGKWIASEREKTGLKANFVSAKAGIDAVHLSRIENGHSGAGRQTIVDIVEAANKHSNTGYKINVDEALRLGGFSTENLISDDDGLFRNLNKLAPTNQKIVKKQMNALIETLAELEQNFDYGEFDEKKEVSNDYATGVPYKDEFNSF